MLRLADSRRNGIDRYAACVSRSIQSLIGDVEEQENQGRSEAHREWGVIVLSSYSVVFSYAQRSYLEDRENPRPGRKTSTARRRNHGYNPSRLSCVHYQQLELLREGRAPRPANQARTAPRSN